jgi:two-component system NtrC family sensor kinase
MKKIITTIFFLIAMLHTGYTQDSNGLSQEHQNILYGLDTAKQDTTRVLLMIYLANYYKTDLPDSALFYGYKALALARQIKFPKGEVDALAFMSIALGILGNDSKALQMALQSFKIAEKNNLDRAGTFELLGITYSGFKNYTKALDLLKQSKMLNDSLGNFDQSALVQNWIGGTYFMMNQLDSAWYYCQSAYKNAVQLKNDGYASYILFNLGRIEAKKGSIDSALAYLRQSLSLAWNADITFQSCFSIAQVYQKINRQDSCIYYANKSLEAVMGRHLYSHIIEANILLSNIYENSNSQKALQYSKMAIAYKDSLDELRKTTSYENFIAYDEQERQYEIETANAAYRNQIKVYVLAAGLVLFLFIAFILYRNNRNKQKAKIKIEKAYTELKSTQAQLIQSEKMASLGELTAGIAHEIQNPLNFVNNFSEVSNEMIDDMNEELEKGDIREAKEISSNVKQNLEKILHHGKRADAIVKGMLQHSRVNTGQKEPTDINALADEYLRLSFHGMRAKDKSFNATINTDFDNSIGKINVVPQDIGRVLLNLFNNAFYAVTEKKKNLTGFENVSGLKSYEPTVSINTKKIDGKVLLFVKDNGTGIPQKVVDKIFQPFFTTKPTGQGTGLGLSLSYDIIKAHGGEIKVESREDEGSEFVIQLPIV